MSRGANGTAAVAADSTHGAARGDRGCFAATGATRRMGEVPGIGSFAVEEIVGFVSHQEFRRVGVAEQDGASGFEASNEWRIGCWNVVFAEQGTGGTGPTGDVD